MAIHDWTRVAAGIFHGFRQERTIEIRNRLNSGVLPAGYHAMADQRVIGPEPNIIALRLRGPEASGGLVVAETPLHTQRAARVETEGALYARKANRIAIHHELGRVVAMIEVVWPGNKDTKHTLASFVAKTVDFISNKLIWPRETLPPSRYATWSRRGQRWRSVRKCHGRSSDRHRSPPPQSNERELVRPRPGS